MVPNVYFECPNFDLWVDSDKLCSMGKPYPPVTIINYCGQLWNKTSSIDTINAKWLQIGYWSIINIINVRWPIQIAIFTSTSFPVLLLSFIISSDPLPLRFHSSTSFKLFLRIGTGWKLIMCHRIFTNFGLKIQFWFSITPAFSWMFYFVEDVMTVSNQIIFILWCFQTISLLRGMYHDFVPFQVNG